jgi:hypothetical protein
METNHLTVVYYKNQETMLAWRDRWAKQGGSFFRTARPLEDLRDLKQIMDWREIEFSQRYRKGWAIRAHERIYGKPQKKVVNLNQMRFARERRQNACRALSATTL